MTDEPATFETSGWSSESTEEDSGTLSAAHLALHDRAGPFLVELFETTQRNPRDQSRIDRLRNELELINNRIRHHNSQFKPNHEADLGVIDVDVFIFTWDEDLNYKEQLEAFCRARNYPMQWARYPPDGTGGYRPYYQKYWENCDWLSVWALLDAAWRLRKAGSDEQLINDLEVLLLEYEHRFNQGLKNLHRKNGNPGSNAFLLQSEDVLESFRVLAECLDTGNQSAYDQGRRNLRSLCSLHGYPLTLVPKSFDEEREGI